MTDNDRAGKDPIGGSKDEVRPLPEEVQQKRSIARNILKEVQRHILKRYYMLFPVIQGLPAEEVTDDLVLAVSGTKLLYNPFVLCRYARQKRLSEVEKLYLHLILHGLLGHFALKAEYPYSRTMDLSMDLEVAAVMADIGGPSFFSYGVDEMGIGMTQCDIDEMADCIRQQGVRAFRNQYFNHGRMNRYLLKALQHRQMDDHSCWLQKKLHPIEPVPGMSDAAVIQLTEKEAAKILAFWKDMKVAVCTDAAGGTRSLILYLKGNSSDQSHGADPLGGHKKFIIPESHPLDFRSVLRQFFRSKEQSVVDLSTIDRELYSLGLQLYHGEAAIVEPEEETEQHILTTLVIAIDTSGSCDGPVMQQFLGQLRHLFRMLAEIRFKEIIRIECDAAIQKEDHFHQPEQLLSMASAAQEEMHGFFGTDFRPVFDRIAELEAAGTEIAGLLYLSDGFGDYPQEKPDYETFFIIPEEDIGRNHTFDQVPDWIHTAVLYTKQ